MSSAPPGENANSAIAKTLDTNIMVKKTIDFKADSPDIVAQISVEEVPVEIYRRAMNLLEELRAEEPSWKNAYIGSKVTLFFRPDIQGPADYEFVVYPSGFIMCAANYNEGPIPHYSTTSKPISSQLEEEAKGFGKTAVKFYKLDALSYAAEDAKGELAASISEMPMMVEGLDESSLKVDSQGIEISLKPLDAEKENDSRKVANRTPEKTGSSDSSLQFKEWPSWKALKNGYASNYRVFLESGRIASEEEWSIQKELKEKGEGLFPGDEYDLALLYPGASFDIIGPGKDYINVEVQKRPNMPEALGIRVLNKIPPDGKAEFSISIVYKNGRKEDIKFVVLDPARVKRQGENENNLKLIGTILAAPQEQKLQIKSHWGPWHTYWAGREEDQRIYCQWDEGGCPIGCGPVAWAMDFCWADHQSWIGADDWDHGGAYSGDAPRYMDDQVRDMIREIHDDVGTFCVGDNGATLPSRMLDAWRYLDGRTTMGFYARYGGLGSRSCRDCARDAIVNRHTPAVIGIGFYSHYPLAWGYRYRESHWSSRTDRDFYINKGWCGSGDGWVDASTFFCGYVYT
jgi:hypothetical protein